ncbi:MAG TPA: OsmC family protein [Chitinophagaceae bacterium]|nr:OsmC family protein [Chitinophagaceae bacterium]
MSDLHHYQLHLKWTGNQGEGTSGYRTYSRDHIISAAGKPDLACSSDPIFRGDPGRYNPEELLVAALSGCHMLWYLHLCADAGIVVKDYTDMAKGTIQISPDGGGHFKEVVLSPVVTLSEHVQEIKALALHQKAGELCFIARSCNFPVLYHALCKIIPDTST